VRDLQSDEVVNNPNIYSNLSRRIAITHRWGPEITYKDLVKIEQINAILRKPKIYTRRSCVCKVGKNKKRADKYHQICLDGHSYRLVELHQHLLCTWNITPILENGVHDEQGHTAENPHINPVHDNSELAKLDNNNVYRLAKLLNVLYRPICLKTTVTEDKAYALVGVLGINFQFAYGDVLRNNTDVSWFVGNFMDFRDICRMQEACTARYDNIIPVTNYGIIPQLDMRNM
jgi:hypothetical protein